MAIVYLDKLMEVSLPNKTGYLNSRSWRPLLTTCLLIASKMWEDSGIQQCLALPRLDSKRTSIQKMSPHMVCKLLQMNKRTYKRKVGFCW
eukprot:1205016-Amphidinium_carterae.1